MRQRVGITSIALAVLLVVGAGAATTASASRLILSEGGTTLASPDAFRIYGKDNLSVTPSSMPVTCQSNAGTGLEVGVVTNSRASDELVVWEVFGGGQPCQAQIGNAHIDLQSVGGPLKLRASGKATTGPAVASIDYERVVYKEENYYNVDCVFSSKKLGGANTATASRQALEVQLWGTLKLDSSRSSSNAKHLCPKTAEVVISLPSSEGGQREEGVIEEQT